MKPALTAAAALVLSATLAAQTAIKPPKNKYKPEDDVKLGREAAAEVRKQYPVIENGQINDYLLDAAYCLVFSAYSNIMATGANVRGMRWEPSTAVTVRDMWLA